MSKITELQAELEELEKRIKAIQLAQTTITELEAIKEYFDVVQDYLTDLNTLYNEHMVTSEDYSTRISTLENQISQIQEQLKNGTGNGNTQELSQQISTMQTELSALQENLTTSLSQIDEKILEQEGVNEDMQEVIALNAANITTIMESNATMQTSINNLTSTQNSLTTTQSNLSSTVSGINSRLATVEANVSTLTNGVDVSGLDNRISTLEEQNGQFVAFEKYNFGFTPQNNCLYTRNYYYVVPNNTTTNHTLDLDYLCESKSGTLTAEIYVNRKLEYTKVINLEHYPSGYKFDFPFKNNYRSNSIKIKFTTTSAVTFNDMNMIITGNNINIIKYDNDLSVHTFNGYVYVTKHLPDRIKFGKFLPTDEIDFDNLPNELLNYDEENCYNYMCFIPFARGSDSETNYSLFADSIIKESNNNYQIIDYYPKQSSRPSVNNMSTNYVSGNMVVGRCAKMIIVVAEQNKIYAKKLDYESLPYTFNSLNNKMPGAWLYATYVDCSFKNFEDAYTSSVKNLLGKYEDGYFYYGSNDTIKYFVKLCKGDYANAYIQPNNDINVYITDGKDMQKYKLVINAATSKYEASFITTITNCDRLYETLENKVIKHNPKNNNWTIETLEY